MQYLNIKNPTPPTTAIIATTHIGDKTHHQLQSIKSHNFKITNTIITTNGTFVPLDDGPQHFVVIFFLLFDFIFYPFTTILTYFLGKFYKKTWWARRDLNPHGCNNQRILSPQRLPFRHMPILQLTPWNSASTSFLGASHLASILVVTRTSPVARFHILGFATCPDSADYMLSTPIMQMFFMARRSIY